MFLFKKGGYCCAKDSPSECPIGATNPLERFDSGQKVNRNFDIMVRMIYPYDTRYNFKLCVRFERSEEDAQMAKTNFKVIQGGSGAVTVKWQKEQVNIHS